MTIRWLRVLAAMAAVSFISAGAAQGAAGDSGCMGCHTQKEKLQSIIEKLPKKVKSAEISGTG